MKTYIISFVAFILIAFNIHSAVVSIPTPKEIGTTVVAAVKSSVENTNIVQSVKTNLNSVMIDILSGVRDAGKEVYGASKEIIRSSVNFVTEQVPDVVAQFLKWQIVKHTFYALGFLIPTIIILYYIKKIKKNIPNTDEGSDIRTFSWVVYVFGIIVSSALIIFGAGKNVMCVTQIVVAPKVYVLEYVVDTIQSNHRTEDSR